MYIKVSDETLVLGKLVQNDESTVFFLLLQNISVTCLSVPLKLYQKMKALKINISQGRPVQQVMPANMVWVFQS